MGFQQRINLCIYWLIKNGSATKLYHSALSWPGMCYRGILLVDWEPEHRAAEHELSDHSVGSTVLLCQINYKDKWCDRLLELIKKDHKLFVSNLEFCLSQNVLELGSIQENILGRNWNDLTIATRPSITNNTVKHLVNACFSHIRNTIVTCRR